MKNKKANKRIKENVTVVIIHNHVTCVPIQKAISNLPSGCGRYFR